MAGVILLLSLAVPGAAQAQVYGGRAFAAKAQVPPVGATATVADTGEMAPTGGYIQARVGEYQDNTFVARAAYAEVYSAAGTSTAYASANDVFASLGVRIEARTCRAAVIVANSPDVFPFSTVSDLYVAGRPVTVTAQPNQRVVIEGVGTLVINEQGRVSSGTFRAGFANALRLTLLNGTEVVVCHAEASVNGFAASPPLPVPPEPCGWLTASGQVQGAASDVAGNASFSLCVGEHVDGQLEGGIEFVDPVAGIRFSSTRIHAYSEDGRRAVVEAEGTLNGEAGHQVRIVAEDNGTPGARLDTFLIQVYTGYSTGGSLVSGEVELTPAPW